MSDMNEAQRLPDRLDDLLSQLEQRRLSRRGFVRAAVLLGLSAGTAEVLSACAVAREPTAIPTPTYSAPGAHPTSTPPLPSMQLEMQLHGGVPNPKELPTYAPPPAITPVPTQAPLWHGTAWSCPVCLNQFGTRDEMLRHIVDRHTVKVPVAYTVDRPTYARYLTGRVARFDQKNDCFCRAVWDKEYQATLFAQVPRQRPETPEQTREGRARIAGGIYADRVGGSIHPKYGGYFGHIRGTRGMYDWDDPTSPARMPVPDPAEMTATVKSVARMYGADLVGITEINPLWVYSRYFERDTALAGPLELPLKYAVVMGIEMDFASIRKSPGFAASGAVATAYSNMAETSSKLAKYIRMLGWEALPSGNDTTQSIPLAIDAGLGELGRNGLLLTPQFGSRLRLCKVYTDLPLVPDQPIDFGLQRFCETCQACAHACPVQAIPRGERSLELTSISNRPGIVRWHVDVGRCLQFWVANGGSLAGLSDCANCISACPWTWENRPWL